MNVWVYVPLGIYLLILLGLGLWSRAAGGGLEGYFVAGKKLPAWVVAFSSNATGESGWLLLGLTGMGYLIGVHAFWVILGEVLGVTLGWVLVARPFKALTDGYGSITVPDYLESRFRDDAGLLRKIGVAIVLSMATVYTAAQMVAAGKAFDSFLATGYVPGVLIGAAVTLFYTAVGGFKAVAYSDFVQGVLMALGLIALPIAGIAAAGGIEAMFANVGAQDPALLLPMGEYGMTFEGVLSAVGMAAIGLAFLGVPQLLVRFMAAGSDRDLVQGSGFAYLCIVIFDVGAVFTGIAGRALYPALEDQETVMPLLSAELFPAIFTGIFLVIVLGAIMSTVDSLLIMSSAAVVRDLVQKTFGSKTSEKRLSFYGRLTTLAIGAIALPFALREAKVLFWFVLFAWSGLGAAFTPVVLCSLFWARTTRLGAAAGMVSGFVVTVVWVQFFKAEFYDLYEMIPGFLAGLVATVVVSLMTEPPEGAEEELEAMRETLRYG